jgi:hypothetical protein
MVSTPSTLNPYSYALNNHVLYTDPSGENPLLLLVGAIGGLLGGTIYGYGFQVINNLNHGIFYGAPFPIILMPVK